MAENACSAGHKDAHNTSLATAAVEPVAEGVGFEPTVGKPTPVFKTGTFGRSVTPPDAMLLRDEVSNFE